MYLIKKLYLVNDLFTHKPYAKASTIEEAKELLPSIVIIEEDECNPNHYDAFTIDGGVFTIEPLGVQ